MNQNQAKLERARKKLKLYSTPGEAFKASPLSQVLSYADIAEEITTSKGYSAPILATRISVTAENKRAEGAPSELKPTKDYGSGLRDTAPNPSQISSTQGKRTYIVALNSSRKDTKEATPSQSTCTADPAKTKPSRRHLEHPRFDRAQEQNSKNDSHNFSTPARPDKQKLYPVSQSSARSNRAHSTSGGIGWHNNITSQSVSQRNVNRKGLPIDEVPEEYRNAILSLVKKGGKAEETYGRLVGNRYCIKGGNAIHRSHHNPQVPAQIVSVTIYGDDRDNWHNANSPDNALSPVNTHSRSNFPSHNNAHSRSNAHSYNTAYSYKNAYSYNSAYSPSPGICYAVPVAG
ncbi:unnamed protein product [Penicillium pancosmium]